MTCRQQNILTDCIKSCLALNYVRDVFIYRFKNSYAVVMVTGAAAVRAASKLAEETQRERGSSHNAGVVSQSGDHARGAVVERSDSQRNASKQVCFILYHRYDASFEFGRKRSSPSSLSGYDAWSGFVPSSSVFSCLGHPSSKPHSLMSCVTLSIHLMLGLPFTRVPLITSIFRCILFPSSMTVQPGLPRYQRDVSTPKPCLVLSFLSLPLCPSVSRLSFTSSLPFLLFPRASSRSFLLPTFLLRTSCRERRFIF